jgi:membrane associated rhomboid family serine protease
MSDPSIEDVRPRREPLINAPWPAMLVTLAIVGSYVVQLQIPDATIEHYVLVPREVSQNGRWVTLFTPLVLHGGWIHDLMNAVAALAFGTPVARRLGVGPRGALVFLLFYLVCGVLSSIGYVLAHPSSMIAVVGASGAVSGLMGGASRLIERRGELGPLVSRTTVGMAVGWVVVNLIIGFVPIMPGMAGAGIAWEAHVAGYFAGLLLIGPFVRLSGHNPVTNG